MERELQEIYDTEVNIRIQSFWDAGYKVAIQVGSEWKYAEGWDFCDLKEVPQALRELISKYHPKVTWENRGDRQIKLAAFCPNPKCDGNCNYQSHATH